MKSRFSSDCVHVLVLAMLAWCAPNQLAAAEAMAAAHEEQVGICVGPPTNLVGWWALDDTAGTIARELTAANHGKIVGGPLPVPGVVHGALSFDGLNDYVEVPDDDLLDFGTGDFSIDAWIKTTRATGAQVIVEKRELTFPGERGYRFFLRQGRPALRIADGQPKLFIADKFVADGKFHHVAVTVDRSSVFTSVLFYVDGVDVLSAPRERAPSGSLDNSAPLRIGSRSPSPAGLLWDGVLDEVEIVHRAMRLAEISDIAHAGAAGKCKCAALSCSPAAWWTFDEVSGQIARDTAGHASGPHDGTLEGATRVFGRVGSALLFDGIDDIFLVPPGGALNVDLAQPSGFSVDAWIRTSDPDTPILGKIAIPTDFPIGYEMFLRGGDLGFAVHPEFFSGSAGGVCTSAACSAINLADDTWHLVGATVTNDGNSKNVTVRLYVDGKLVETFPPVDLEGNAANDSHFVIGLRGGSRFPGKIDEVEIFDRALSEADFSSIYTAGEAGKCKPAAPPQICGLPESSPCPAGQFCDQLPAGECGLFPIGICRIRPEACVPEGNPVCGCNGKTYPNSCFAAIDGVSIAALEPCP